MAQPLGRVKGPGDKPYTFLFIAPDTDQALKSGEFITYETVVDGRPQTVLARVIDRRPRRLLPDSFSSNPLIDPNLVAGVVGYSNHNKEMFEITGEIIGYYEAALRDFINPRMPPRLGTPIEWASDSYLSQVLSRVQQGQPGAATIGWLSTRPPEQVSITIDVAAIASTHLAIIANTGAGKSYTASVLIEEMLKPNNRAAVLIIDPHGEYSTLTEIANHPDLSANSYRPEAKLHKPGTFKIRLGTLTQGDLRYLLPNLSDRMEYALNLGLRRAQSASYKRCQDENCWTRQELLDAMKDVGEVNENDEEDDRYKGTADALIWRLRSILTTGEGRIFDDVQQTPLTDLLRPGLCTIVQLDQVEQHEQQVVVASLLRRIYEARLHSVQNQTASNDDLYLPYPVFVLIEEAHHFAPAGSTIISSGILKQILAEGRKFGVAVGLISQRPGKLDPDALSQCNTLFLLRIANPIDQARVAESVESVGRELLGELPALNKGQAIITGAAVNTPVICNIRSRYTHHGANDINAPQEWMSYLDAEQTKERERDSALLHQPRRSGGLLKGGRT